MHVKKTTLNISALNSLKKGLFLIATLFITTLCYGQNNIGQINDRSSTNNYRSIDGWGEYTVKAGSSTDKHDPRIERRGLTKLKPGDKRTFEATYRILSAKNTTFAQILNQDQRTNDKHKPVVFVIAEPSGNNWKLRDQGFSLGTVPKNSEFVLRIDTYYNSNKTKAFSDIYINGVKKETKTHARVGQDAQMRYGNYHHGSGTATIRVKNVTWQTTAEYLGNGGGGNPSPTPPVNNKNDDISSVNAPTSVQKGKNVSIKVNYSASTNRDVVAIFQLDQSPWTSYASQKKDVSGGSGTLTFNFNIPSNTPVANNKYQFQTYITTNNGGWDNRLDNIAKTNVDVVNSGGGSGGGNSSNVSQGIYRFQNVFNNGYMDAESGRVVKLKGPLNHSDQQWALHATSGGYYNIDSRSNGSGLLDTDSNGVIKWSTTGPKNMNEGFQWKPIKLSNGNYRFENRTNGRKYLRYNGDANVIGYSNAADVRSEWKLTRVGALKTSVEENASTAISVYPNPASSRFNIRLSGSGNTSISIMNIQGQRIDKYQTSDNQLSLDASNWTPGVYFINAIDESGTIESKKLFVK